MHARDPVPIPRPQAQRISSQQSRTLRSAMRRLHLRDDAQLPSALVQTRAELDILVVREEALVEYAILESFDAIERGGRGDAPRATCFERLAIRAVADVDAGAVKG